MITTKTKVLENAARWKEQNENLVKELGFKKEFATMAWKAIKRYSDVVKRYRAAEFVFNKAFKDGEDASELMKKCEERYSEMLIANSIVNCFVSDKQMELLINLEETQNFISDIENLKEDTKIEIEETEYYGGLMGNEYTIKAVLIHTPDGTYEVYNDEIAPE